MPPSLVFFFFLNRGEDKEDADVGKHGWDAMVCECRRRANGSKN